MIVTIGGRDIESIMEDLDAARAILERWEEGDDVSELRSAVQYLTGAADSARHTARQLDDEADEYEEGLCEECGAPRCETCGTCPNKCADGSTVVMECCGV